MRSAFLFPLLGAWALLTPTPVAASPHEARWLTGGHYYQSNSQTVAGAGYGVGYSYHLSDSLAFQAEGLHLLGLGNSYAVSVGLAAQSVGSIWQPAAGLRLIGLLGDRVRFLSSQAPQPTTGVPVVLEARLTPFRFATGAFTTSLFTVGVGLGWDESGTATAYSLSLFDIGWHP